MKILFISRAYPPIIGGIEKQNYEVSAALKKIANVDIIANKHGKKLLPLFIPYALVKALITLPKYDVVLLGDGVLGVVGYVIKKLSSKPVYCIVHGLDITFKNRIYQKLWVQIFLPSLTRLIAVGNETIHQGNLRGISKEKFTFIPNGVELNITIPDYSHSELEKLAGKKLKGPVLLTLGRLVKRKGVAWFIQNVMVDLAEDITYLIAGDGSEKDEIISQIKKLNLQERVVYLGRVSETEKEILLSKADIFIQPNIKVIGDMEGFGLVVLEAASYELPVIASKLEGLQDAITHNVNGLLVQPNNADAYIQTIKQLLEENKTGNRLGISARKHVDTYYGWDHIAKKYMKIISS